MITLRKILSISRPRFWLYEFGTFALGVIAALMGGGQADWSQIALFGIYFLIPANILIYGINDIFDYETDRLNPKKVAYEALLLPKYHRSVWYWIVATNILFVLAGVLLLDVPVLVALLGFVFFAVFYSAWPIRAKIRPGLDSFFSASHYVITAVVGFFIAGGADMPWLGIVGGIMWAMAMHAYSAVPDIESDTKAGLATIATRLGKEGTLVLCGVFYVASACIAGILLSPYLSVAAIVYVAIMGLSAVSDKTGLLRIYTWFPWVNGFMGMIVTLILLGKILL